MFDRISSVHYNVFRKKENGGTEMLEYEIEIGKEEQDALLEIALNSKEYRKKRKVEAIKFSIQGLLYFAHSWLHIVFL